MMNRYLADDDIQAQISRLPAVEQLLWAAVLVLIGALISKNEGKLGGRFVGILGVTLEVLGVIIAIHVLF